MHHTGLNIGRGKNSIIVHGIFNESIFQTQLNITNAISLLINSNILGEAYFDTIIQIFSKGDISTFDGEFIFITIIKNVVFVGEKELTAKADITKGLLG